MMRFLIEWWNALRGYGFDLRDGTFEPRTGTCPAPLSHDWSEKRCIKDGNCGCSIRARIGG